MNDIKSKKKNPPTLAALAALGMAFSPLAAESSQTLLILDTFNSAANNNPSIGHTTAGRQSGILAPTPITGDAGSIAGNRYAVSVSGAFTYLQVDLKAALEDPEVTGFTISTEAMVTSGDWVAFFLTTHSTAETRGPSRMGFHMRPSGAITVYSGTAAAKTDTNISNAAMMATFSNAWSATTMRLFEFRATKTDATSGTFDLYIDGVAIPTAQKLPYHLGNGNNAAGLAGRYNLGGVGLTTAAAWDNWKAVAISETPAPLRMTIAPNGSDFDFSWNSQPGKVYDLLASADLATPIAQWPVYDDGEMLYENIPATGTTTTLTAVASSGPRRFFAIREEDAPPLFSADFEANDGGFTTSKTAGSDWQWGAPISSNNGPVNNPGGTVTTGNGGSAKCWGTNIANPGFYADPTTESCLISPVINLTSVAGAELSFAHAIDLQGDDTAVLRIIHADTDAIITTISFTDANSSSASWQSAVPIALPVGAPIRLVWCLTGTGGPNNDYMGWYIDDVVVVQTIP